VFQSVPTFLAAIARDFWALRLIEPSDIPAKMIGVLILSCGAILVFSFGFPSGPVPTSMRSGLRPM
jgi:hypothetical protein